MASTTDLVLEPCAGHILSEREQIDVVKSEREEEIIR